MHTVSRGRGAPICCLVGGGGPCGEQREGTHAASSHHHPNSSAQRHVFTPKPPFGAGVARRERGLSTLGATRGSAEQPKEQAQP